jgi:sugar phosphate isomerase/epimerase
MLISVSSWSYRDLFAAGTMDYESFLAEAKRIGAEGIEIFPGYLDPADPMGHVQRIADRAENLGLSIATLITRNNFAIPCAADRAKEIERIRQCIVTAASSGIQRLNMFTGDHTEGEDPEAEYFRVLDCYRELTPFAEQNCITFCLENCSTVCPDADGILRVVSAIDSPALRTNPDPTNFAHCCGFTGDKMFEQTRKLMPFAASFHLRVGRFSADGESVALDMRRTIAMLREFAYAGHIVIEYEGGPDPIGACERGVALVKKYSR